MKKSSDLKENPPGNRILHLSFSDEAPSTSHRHTSSLHPGVWEQCGSGNGISLITLLALQEFGSRKREKRKTPAHRRGERGEGPRSWSVVGLWGIFGLPLLENKFSLNASLQPDSMCFPSVSALFCTSAAAAAAAVVVGMAFWFNLKINQMLYCVPASLLDHPFCAKWWQKKKKCKKTNNGSLTWVFNQYMMEMMTIE